MQSLAVPVCLAAAAEVSFWLLRSEHSFAFAARRLACPFQLTVGAGLWVQAARPAIGRTLAAIPHRAYSAPASKYSEVFRQSLAPGLRRMLEWELPLESEWEPVAAAAPRL